MTNNQDFAWINDNVAVCVSVVAGPPAASRPTALAKPGDIEFATQEEAVRWAYDEPRDYRFWLATGDVQGAGFVWEDNGFRGSDEGTAEALSSSSVFASVYWNVNALSAFTFARDGEIAARFEVLWGPNESEWQALVDAGATRISDAEWESAPWASALRLQSQVLGVQVAHPSWLERPGVRFWGGRF